MSMKKLTDDQMDSFLKNKEFGADVIEAAPNTAVVLTQDWCPQWTAMKRYLSEIPESEAAVFFIEYNREPRGNNRIDFTGPVGNRFFGFENFGFR